MPATIRSVRSCTSTLKPKSETVLGTTADSAGMDLCADTGMSGESCAWLTWPGSVPMAPLVNSCSKYRIFILFKSTLA